MYPHICQNCKTAFRGRLKEQKYCSSKCRDKANRPPTAKGQTRTCQRCGSSFVIKTKISVFCSRRCQDRNWAAKNHQRRLKYNAEKRRRQVESGLCYECGRNPPIVGLIRCQSCLRKKVETDHKNGNHTTYLLGARSHPNYVKYRLAHIKLNNPGLKESWSEIEPFIKENIELWHEPYDDVLQGTYSLNMISEERNPFINEMLIKAYYGRNNGVSLEDYVISEIDKQRERWAALI